MRYQVSDDINGVPVKDARYLVRLFLSPDSVDWVAQRVARDRGRGFGVDSELRDRVLDCLDRLCNAGFLERINPGEQSCDGVTAVDLTLQATVEGRRFANCSFARPISRKKADDTLAKVVDRATTLNQLTNTLYYVKRLAVFGSYLNPEAEKLSDLDILYWLAARPIDASMRHIPRRELIINHAMSADRRFNHFMDVVFWGETEVLLRLKARQRSAQLCCGSLLTSNPEIKHRIVFEAAWHEDPAPYCGAGEGV